MKIFVLSLTLGLALVATGFAAGAETEGPENSGGLKIDATPPGARVYLDGKLVGRTPLELAAIRAGEHIVRLKLDRHADYLDTIRIEPGRTAVALIQMDSRVYYAWQAEHTRLVSSALLLPGKGQIDAGRKRGWGYFFGFLAVGGYAWYNYDAYHKSEDDYEKAWRAYLAEDDPLATNDKYHRAINKLSDMDDQKARYEIAFGVAAGIWALNVIDAAFFTIPKPVMTSSAAGRFDWYADPGRGSMGLAVRF